MEEKKDRVGLALLFSFLVALAGSVVWGLVYSTGWLVALIGYVTALGCFFVYTRFAKMSKLTFIWTLVWVIVLNILATYVALVVYTSVKYGLALSEVISSLTSNFVAVTKELMSDIILGIVFSILGVVSYYTYYKRNLKAKELEQARKEALNQQYGVTTLEEKDESRPVEVKEAEIVSTEPVKEDLWECKSCGVLNKSSDTKCSSCGSPRIN